MASHTCDWWVLEEYDDHDQEVPCGKPAVAHIDWGDGVIYWYCAEHYDMRISYIKECGRRDVLEASGVR
jgi:hypothetical protein